MAHPLSSLSAATVLALMSRRTPPRLTLVTEEATAVRDIRSIAPQRPTDGVFEDPFLDCIGRRQFVAVDEKGRELMRLVAVSEENVARVTDQLWELMDSHHARLRPRLIRN